MNELLKYFNEVNINPISKLKMLFMDEMKRKYESTGDEYYKLQAQQVYGMQYMSIKRLFINNGYKVSGCDCNPGATIVRR